MSVRREHPKCRKQIEYLLETFEITLEELAGKPPIYAKSGVLFPLSDGMRTQARKMLEEKDGIK